VSVQVAADVCRVVLIAPHRTLEVALPQSVPLADLIPVLVQRVTLPGVPRRKGRSHRPGLTGHGDWVLQRLGGPPLEEDLTPAALRILDGETLYLRPRGAHLPPAHFDDLIDGLATGLQSRPDRWRDSMTGAMFLILGGIALATCFAVLLDPEFTGRGTVAGGIAAILLLGAMMFSRGLGDGWAALTLGFAAVPFASLAGWLVPPRPGGVAWLSANMLCASVAASLTALLVIMAVGEHRAVFLAIWIVGAAGSLGGLLAVIGLTATQAAGTIVTLVLVMSTFAPGIAFRLARLRLPQMPTGAADLSDDIDPYPAPQIMAGAAAADTYLTWISIGVGVSAGGGMAVLARDNSWKAIALVAAVSLVLIVRSRGLGSAWQRASALVPAVLGPALFALYAGTGPDPGTRMLAVIGLVVIAGLMLVLSRAMPGRRMVPHWGRLVDFFEYVFAIAMVVLLLAIYDAYQWARSIAG
jgi:type VII secretion integral membrane protein EccD